MLPWLIVPVPVVGLHFGCTTATRASILVFAQDICGGAPDDHQGGRTLPMLGGPRGYTQGWATSAFHAKWLGFAKRWAIEMCMVYRLAISGNAPAYGYYLYIFWCWVSSRTLLGYMGCFTFCLRTPMYRTPCVTTSPRPKVYRLVDLVEGWWNYTSDIIFR